MRTGHAGITLIELVLVVALIALLGSIGIPAYSAYAQRTRIVRAVSDIGVLSLQLHRWQAATGRLPEVLSEADLDGLLAFGATPARGSSG
jgi:Tfp pilus assembly protein PilE